MNVVWYLSVFVYAIRLPVARPREASLIPWFNAARGDEAAASVWRAATTFFCARYESGHSLGLTARGPAALPERSDEYEYTDKTRINGQFSNIHAAAASLSVCSICPTTWPAARCV